MRYIIPILLLCLVVCADAATTKPKTKRAHEYTCPRCRKVEIWADVIPQARYCTGTEDRKHSRQKMRGRLKG